MQITGYPTRYQSAFQQAIYTIEAAAQDVIDVQIYDHADSTVIGIKRATGALSHQINVANYVKSQLNVNPIYSATCTAVSTTGRAIRNAIRFGEESAQTVLCGAIRPINFFEKLSKSPQIKKISPIECDELSILVEGLSISAKATFIGKSNTFTTQIIAPKYSDGVMAMVINMNHINQIVQAQKGVDVSTYDMMEVAVYVQSSVVYKQIYQIIPNITNDVRICWWNSLGSVDYFTLKSVSQKELVVNKKRIMSSGEYKVVANSADVLYEMVSDYENRQTMEWISEIIASPKVWIVKPEGVFEQIDVISNKTTVFDQKLLRLEMSARNISKITYQSL